MNFDINDNGCILEGIISVEAAIKGGKRRVELVHIDSNKIKKRDRKTLGFVKKLQEKLIPYEVCDREVINAFVAEKDRNAGSTHGGIVAVCGDRDYSDPYALLAKTADDGGFCVLLDGVEDPFNFGYSVRNLYAAGATGIIIPERNWMSAAGVCARASAGATELCDIAILPDMSDTASHNEFVRRIKKQGLSVVCAAKTADCTDIYEFEPCFPSLLVIGGEKRGISPEFIDGADEIVCIPYKNDVRYSLPTASTAAIFGFEFARYFKK